MNLRMKIVEQLMSSLFDDDREYLPDCEDAALEIMKLIAADPELVSTMRAAIEHDDIAATVNELRDLAAQYNDLMEERERAENGEGERSVERIDEEIDELLGETMAVTGRLLSAKSEPPVSVDEPVRSIHVGVVCRNSSGEPDVVFYYVNQTETGIMEGEHFEIAKVHAANDGYETPMIPFDEDDAIYPRLVSKHVPSSDKE